jgi:hypothetical protein
MSKRLVSEAEFSRLSGFTLEQLAAMRDSGTRFPGIRWKYLTARDGQRRFLYRLDKFEEHQAAQVGAFVASTLLALATGDRTP